MAKLALMFLTVVAVLGPPSIQRGCKDVQSAFTKPYPRERDMRNTVGLVPNKHLMLTPDSMSVPLAGKERWNPADQAAERERLDRTFVVPRAADDASIARGELKYRRTCVPCHGQSLKGDGPVSAKYVPPPDLLAAMTRGRSDGFIYGYIRHGGAVMPSYGAMVTAHEACDLIHYIRHMQKTSPR